MRDSTLWIGRPVVTGSRSRALVLALICAAAMSLSGCDLLPTTPEPTVAPNPTAAPPATVPTESPEPPPDKAPTPTPVVTVPPQPTPTQPVPPAPTAPPPTLTPTRVVPTQSPTVAVRGRVGTAAVARSIDSQQRPRERATEFDAGERVYVSAEFIGIGAGSTIGIAWKRGDEPVFVYEQPVQSAFTRGYFAFYLDPGDAIPGAYSADVLIDGQVQREVAFTIRG
ncbi:MAG: hypothetical protein OXP37_08505 [Chloroflexota bacterium]|nr:hypothetical protein [Chloroflexota bacterium]